MFEKKPIIYFASPYSHPSKKVREQRATEMLEITARVINEQDAIVPFVPIAYLHPLTVLCPDHDWVSWDIQFLARFDGMIVVKQPGWETSLGIKEELNFCFEHGIPYAYSKPEDIIEVCRNMVISKEQNDV